MCFRVTYQANIWCWILYSFLFVNQDPCGYDGDENPSNFASGPVFSRSFFSVLDRSNTLTEPGYRSQVLQRNCSLAEVCILQDVEKTKDMAFPLASITSRERKGVDLSGRRHTYIYHFIPLFLGTSEAPLPLLFH